MVCAALVMWLLISSMYSNKSSFAVAIGSFRNLGSRNVQASRTVVYESPASRLSLEARAQSFPPSWSKTCFTEAFEALRAGRQLNLRSQGLDVFVRLLRSTVHLPCRTGLDEGHVNHSDIPENLAQVGLQRVKPFSRGSRFVFACARDDHSRLLTAEKAFIAAISIHFESNSTTNDMVNVSF